MEQLNYKHFLITRFNLKNKAWTNDKNNNSLVGVNDAWLKKRFFLFETYCLPSVKAQVNKDFKWLVYFDVDTPQIYKSKIESYQSAFPNFTPRFLPDMDHLSGAIKQDITDGNNDISNLAIITTRLDNDDSLHESFMETVQQFIRKNKVKKGVVDIPYGYCLQIEPNAILYSSIQFSNAFITYVEPFTSKSAMQTVLDKIHPEWIYSVKTYFINYKRLWLQVIHENNILNDIQGVANDDKNNIIPFNLNGELQIFEGGKKQALLNNYVKYPFYYLLKQVKRVKKMQRIFRKKNK